MKFPFVRVDLQDRLFFLRTSTKTEENKQFKMGALLSGAPNDSFLSDPLKRYFRLSGVALKLYRFILGSAIIFLSVRSF